MNKPVAGMNTEVISLVPERLYQLPNPYELNGLVASHPVWARGWAPLNSYLLVEDGRALLVDSGFSVHEDSILAQLSSLIDVDTPLDFWPTAFGEFGSICNVHAITDCFNVVRYHMQIPLEAGGGNAALDFRPEYTPFGEPVGAGSMATVEYSIPGDLLKWSGGRRNLDLFVAPLTLLPFKCGYDRETGTLFSGDLYNHVWRDTPAGPWTVQPGEAPPTLDSVYNFLVGSRYWWLPGAATDDLEAAFVEFFERWRYGSSHRVSGARSPSRTRFKHTSSCCKRCCAGHVTRSRVASPSAPLRVNGHEPRACYREKSNRGSSGLATA